MKDRGTFVERLRRFDQRIEKRRRRIVVFAREATAAEARGQKALAAELDLKRARLTQGVEALQRQRDKLIKRGR